MRDATASAGSADEVRVRVVDCDVHPVPGSIDEFVEHYPEPFRSRYFGRYKDEVPLGFHLYTPHSNIGGNQGMGGPGGYAVPESGGGMGSDPDFLAKQLCVDHGTDYMIINPLFFRPRHWDPEWDAAHAMATNDWLVANWLEGDANKHGRFFASLQVSSMDPDAAVREVERWAGHPAFVQSYMFADSFVSFGQPYYEPLLAASAKYNMPLATHLFRHSGVRSMTPVGFPSYHVEALPNWSYTYIAHITSTVFEGVFERYPNLKFVAVEGGCEWAGPLLWRLDRQWDRLREEIPQTTRRPSEIIREHVRFGTQPLCEPHGRNDLQQFMEWGHADETMVFSSDYPHYDFDPAPWVAQQLPEPWRHRVMADNALETYGLPKFRKRDYLDDMEGGGYRLEAGQRRYYALEAAGARGDTTDVPWVIESVD
jgi:predicted TIM-barrel fold metal-dependent hydrolase